MIDNPESLGTTLLAPLRDEPLGPSSVSLEAAVRTGRRRTRRRRAAAACAILVVGALAGTAALVERTVPHDAAQPLVAAEFDPRYQAFTIEPPAGYRITTVTTNRVNQIVSLVAPGRAQAEVMAYLRDPSLVFDRLGSPVDLGDGRKAYRRDCAVDAQVCGQVVAYRADGIDVMVTVMGEPADLTMNEAIADANALLSTVSPERVDLPIHAPLRVQAPPGLPLQEVSVTENGIDLIYSSAPPNTDAMITVSVGTFELPADPPDTVDGHPAMVNDSEIVIYPIVGRWSLRVSAQPANPLGGREELLDFVHERVHMVPDPDDRASWPTL